MIAALRPLAVIGLAASLLSACTILPKSEPNTIYLLPTATQAAASKAAPLAWSLRVNKPKAVLVLDSPRIAVVPQGSEITNYKGARWGDNAPVLLRDHLLDGFQADGRVSALSTDDTQLQADMELVSDLRAFQSEYQDGQVKVVIRLDVRLVQGAARTIVATRRFDVQQRASSVNLPDVIAAFGAASNALNAQLVPWVIEQGQQRQR